LPLVLFLKMNLGRLVLLLLSAQSACGFLGFRFGRFSSTRVQRLATGEQVPGDLKARLAVDMKEALKSKEKERLSAVRAIQTAIKQKEVDERVTVGDDECLAICAKLVKMRRESITSYKAAGRDELVAAEEAELKWIQAYMPAQMSPEDISNAIKSAIAKVGASSVKDMGKVMAELRPTLQGKADMSAVGPEIKKLLGA